VNGDGLTLEQFLAAIVRLNNYNAEDITRGYQDGFNGEIGEGNKSAAYWRSHRNGSEAKARGAHQPRLDESA
jgi:hypothetical protein